MSNEFIENADLRLHQIGVNNAGEKMEILEYNGYDDIIVMFHDMNGCKVHTQYMNFVNGNVKNYMSPTHGYHGFIGQGDYQSEYRVNGKRVKDPAYEVWRKMHLRCENFDDKHPAYADVTIAKEWWNYQNFAEWYHSHMYKVDDEVMCLDKDIKYPGNRHYGPEACIIVPNRINELFKRGDKKENATDLPPGVTIRKDGSTIRYRARCSVRVGYREYKTISKTFKTPEEAFKFYKEAKEQYIKDVALEYKDKLPKEVFKAVYNYEIPYEL